MIVAYADTTTNFDWVVAVDGVVVASFRTTRYGNVAVYHAARYANAVRNGNVPEDAL